MSFDSYFKVIGWTLFIGGLYLLFAASVGAWGVLLWALKFYVLGLVLGWFIVYGR